MNTLTRQEGRQLLALCRSGKLYEVEARIPNAVSVIPVPEAIVHQGGLQTCLVSASQAGTGCGSAADASYGSRQGGLGRRIGTEVYPLFHQEETRKNEPSRPGTVAATSADVSGK